MRASGGIMNSTVNKSGHNITNNFKSTRSKAPQTHRNGLNTQNTIGSTSGGATGRTNAAKHLLNGLMNPSVISNGSAQMYSVQDKENRQRLSNKGGASSKAQDQQNTTKRHRTTDAPARLTGPNSKSSASNNHTSQGSGAGAPPTNPRSSHHTRSKGSEMEVCSSSHGTISQRNNSAHNHASHNASTHGAASRRSQGRRSLQQQHSSQQSSKQHNSQAQGSAQGFKNASSANIGHLDLVRKRSDQEMREVLAKSVVGGASGIQSLLPQSHNEPVRAQQSQGARSGEASEAQAQTAPAAHQPAVSRFVPTAPGPASQRPFDAERLDAVAREMEGRRREWLRKYKTKLDLNDVLEIRNPQSVVEFIPEIVVNMRAEEQRHLYPASFLGDRSFQSEISDKYRQYLVDWLAELHYKFKMWAETLYVTVGIIDKTLMRWRDFQKGDLQLLGITALHIAGKYEEIYPPELKTILDIIENAVTRENVCRLESQILQTLDFDMVWPSILRFMERYACIAAFNSEQ